jgi:hypothetical protein
METNLRICSRCSILGLTVQVVITVYPLVRVPVPKLGFEGLRY